MIITTINLLIVGVGLFQLFAFYTLLPCPRKYRVLQEKGGVLTNLGQIHEYCELDYGGKFVLKEGVEE